MISINLLPPDLRKSRKKGGLSVGINLPLEVVVGLGGGLIAILILFHVGLLATQVIQIARKKSLKARWEKIAPEKKVVDGIILELRDLQNNCNTIEGFTKRDVWWSQKLNIVSDQLSSGVWLRRILVEAGKLQMDGSAVLKQNTGMGNVHSFVANLKESSQFLNKLSNLELGSINTRSVNKTDIADFVIKANVNEN